METTENTPTATSEPLRAHNQPITHADGDITIRVGGANVTMTMASALSIVDEPDLFASRLAARLKDAGVNLDTWRMDA